MSRYAPTPEVMAIGQINISGNVTPANWWKYIRLPSGRPDATAIALLSEIVYWYRPTEVRDEHTGALLGYRKRFQGDKLQRSYQAFAEQFGFGKRETADALKRLRDAGFITLDLRTVEMLDGVKCSNILFVGINPQAIAAITTPSSVSPESNSNNAISDTAITLKRNTPRRHNGTGDTPNVDTNTEITTKTTAESTQKNTTEMVNGYRDNPILSYQAAEEQFKDQIDYDAIWIDRPFDRKLLNEIVGLAVDVLTSNAKTIRVNQEERPLGIVQGMYKKLDKFTVEYVIDSIKQCTRKANNIRAVLLTALYNATLTANSYISNLFAYQEAIPQT